MKWMLKNSIENTTYVNHFIFFKRHVITPLTRGTDNKRKR